MNTNQYKGVAEVEIYGEKRGFKFGIAQMAMLSQVTGFTMKEITERLADSYDFEIQLAFFYTAAIQYHKLFKVDGAEPSKEEVANWIDGWAEEDHKKVMEIAFKKVEIPNEEALKTETAAGQ